jgi:arabinose-5-phosphate isomerase
MSSFTQKHVPANETDEVPFAGGIHLAAGRAALERDSRALVELADRLGASFERSVDLVLACTGRVFVCGDDSMHALGAKVASALNRAGTPSVWVHANNAQESQCSFANKRDLFVLLSSPCHAETLLRLVPQLDDCSIRSIGLFLRGENPIARRLTASVSCSSAPQANTSPRAGGTPEYYLNALAMAFVDAIAAARNVTLTSSEMGGDGQWLKRLSLKAGDLMRTDLELPSVTPDTPARETLAKLKASDLQMVCVVNDGAKLAGVIGAHELINLDNIDQHANVAKDLMRPSARSIDVHTPISEAMRLMKQEKLDVLPVESEMGQLVGVLSLHDLLL